MLKFHYRNVQFLDKIHSLSRVSVTITRPNFWISGLAHLVFLLPRKNFKIIWLSNLSAFSIHDKAIPEAHCAHSIIRFNFIILSWEVLQCLIPVWVVLNLYYLLVRPVRNWDVFWFGPWQNFLSVIDREPANVGNQPSRKSTTFSQHLLVNKSRKL